MTNDKDKSTYSPNTIVRTNTMGVIRTIEKGDSYGTGLRARLSLGARNVDDHSVTGEVLLGFRKDHAERLARLALLDAASLAIRDALCLYADARRGGRNPHTMGVKKNDSYVKEVNLGAALRNCVRAGKLSENSANVILRRLTSDTMNRPALMDLLIQTSRRLSGAQVQMSYHRLAQDLFNYYNGSDERVRLNWSQSYYISAGPAGSDDGSESSES